MGVCLSVNVAIDPDVFFQAAFFESVVFSIQIQRPE